MTFDGVRPDTLTVVDGDWEQVSGFINSHRIQDDHDPRMTVERVLVETESASIELTSDDGSIQVRDVSSNGGNHDSS